MGGPGRESYLIINRYINLEFLHNNGPQNNQHLPCELPYFACKFLAVIQRLLTIIQVTASIEVGMSLHFVKKIMKLQVLLFFWKIKQFQSGQIQVLIFYIYFRELSILTRDLFEAKAEQWLFNPIPTGLGHVTLIYGLIPPMAGRNRVKSCF